MGAGRGGVLITGGGGFLGRLVTAELASRGEAVTLFDLKAPAEDAVGDGIEVLIGDVTDADRVDEAIAAAQPRAVVHLAAVLTPAAARDPVLATRVNCLGAACVFTACQRRKVRRTIFASSVTALSTASGLSTGDDRPISPRSVYGATKAYAEYLARALRESDPTLDLFGIRFGWLYGPGRLGGWNEVQDVIEGFAQELPKVRYPVFGKPMDWTFVDDARDALLAALRAPHPRLVAYNVSGEYRTVEDAVQILSRWFPGVAAEGYPAAMPPSAFEFETDAARSEIGVTAPTSLEEGLRLTVEGLQVSRGVRPAT